MLLFIHFMCVQGTDSGMGLLLSSSLTRWCLYFLLLHVIQEGSCCHHAELLHDTIVQAVSELTTSKWWGVNYHTCQVFNVFLVEC